MKTLLLNRINLIMRTSIIGVVLIALLTSNKVSAQRGYFIPQNLYIGFETSSGNRSFALNSDLANLRSVNIEQHGQSYGIIIGSQLIMGRIKLGSYNSTNHESNPIKSSIFEIGGNLNALQLFKNKVHTIEPYVTTSFEVTSIKSSGIYTPHLVAPAKKPSGGGSCDSDSMPANPDAIDPAPPVAKPTPYSGNFGTTRFTMGVGVKIHITKGNHFLNLFSEMKYGIPLGTTSSTQALESTYILTQTSLEVGAAIGFIRNKSNHHARRISFR